MKKPRPPITAPRRRAAFTLVEILAVIAIVMLIAGVVLSINPGNPEGIVSAQNSVRNVFRAARIQSQSENPDRSSNAKVLYNMRSRVIILKDPTLPALNLRLVRVIIGGTEKSESTQPEDYWWFSTGTEYILPKGVYMVDADAAVQGDGEGFDDNRRSQLSNKDAPTTEMQMDYKLTTRGQKNGGGDKTWYFYEFNSDGTSNMNFATFMVSVGAWNAQRKRVLCENRDNVAGFWISPSGETVPY
ncbi:MAG: type II secretion system GspH family protein, partial [Puniceicoccales bacterium]|nr:type II secretion system GspH family protein [Puniceicoccales bacterium]